MWRTIGLLIVVVCLKGVNGDEDDRNDFETWKLEGLQEYGGESRFWIACTDSYLIRDK
jgi:hypothetical protein